jgi:hypothetical protein
MAPVSAPHTKKEMYFVVPRKMLCGGNRELLLSV